MTFAIVPKVGSTDMLQDASKVASVDSVGNFTFTGAVSHAQQPQQGTTQATTSGTAFDFPVPTWAKKITLIVDQVSLAASGVPVIQLRTSGGLVVSGYTSLVNNYNNANTTSGNSATVGMVVSASVAPTSNLIGTVTLLRLGASNTWVSSTVVADYGGTAIHTGGGRVDLPGLVTGLRLTTAAGAAFDAGSANILIE